MAELIISPNELHQAARDTYLGGQEPTTRHEWILCVNFWAANIAVTEVEACHILGLIHQCPLKRDEIVQIAQYQQKQKHK
jgi:hypothetical protein